MLIPPPSGTCSSAPLLVLVYPLLVLVCPLLVRVCPLLVLVCPLLVRVCALLVLVCSLLVLVCSLPPHGAGVGLTVKTLVAGRLSRWTSTNPIFGVGVVGHPTTKLTFGAGGQARGGRRPGGHANGVFRPV